MDQTRLPESHQSGQHGAPVVSGHTPTPWDLSGVYVVARAPKTNASIAYCGGSPILDKAEKYANAAFIVRAVNSHACLLSAIEGLLALARQMNDGSDEGGQLDERYDNACALLLSAREVA